MCCETVETLSKRWTLAHCSQMVHVLTLLSKHTHTHTSLWCDCHLDGFFSNPFYYIYTLLYDEFKFDNQLLIDLC